MDRHERLEVTRTVVPAAGRGARDILAQNRIATTDNPDHCVGCVTVANPYVRDVLTLFAKRIELALTRASAG